MHIGIVSSSLGGRGSDLCDPNATNPTNPALNRHNDDRGRLINRGGDTETPKSKAQPSNFLAWFPPVDANNGHPQPTVQPITEASTLIADFQDMIKGVHEYGCGFEAQLESWYRFLVQPDPYDTLERDGNRVKLTGVDGTILKQRKDFLRDDSLVAIIVVTDENDSTVDPMWLGGQGWVFENQAFPNSPTGGAPKATQACASNPNDQACNSCAFQSGDPGCQPDAYYTTTEDNLNQRFFHMKRRFGVDPQFPISRYVNGLTKPTVPNRDGEHPGNSSNYVGKADCINPLFATNLPEAPDAELCKLQRGARTPDLVFFAVIGGVPWQLLLEDPNNPASSKFKTKFVGSDFEKLLGTDPLNYNFTNADPHMLESLVPRDNMTPSSGQLNTDPNQRPFNGREWDTGGGDLQYACVFTLPSPKNCTDPKFKEACDCTDAGKTGGALSPLCDPNNKTTQVRGKAYPTIREFEVVRKLGDQGIIASLCPRSLDQANEDFGYRPAVRAIVDRLKNALANQCLPQPLSVFKDSNGQDAVRCLILETLPAQGGQDECTAAKGLAQPDPEVLRKFREQQEEEWKASGGDKAGIPNPNTYPVCQVTQLPANVDCVKDPKAGWCYVSGKSAGTCSQAILFSEAGNPPPGAKISLQCIEEKGGETAPAPAGDGGT
jgi:hypothetical protein